MRRLALLTAGLLLAGPAVAHPEHEVVQGAYVTLAPGAVRLQLELAVGPKVAPAVLRALDANGDGDISDAEARAYGARVLRLSDLTLDGATQTLRLERVEAPPYSDVATAASPIRIYAVAAQASASGAHTLVYRNRYRPAESRCFGNVFLAKGAQARVDGQTHSPDGRQLTVKFTARVS